MISSYLQSGDYPNFGLPSSTTQAQVNQASVLLDGFLGRPDGLVWAPGADGQPCYMVAKNPDLTLTASAPFGPGQQSVVPVTGPIQAIQIGDCVTIDRANMGETEAVQIVGIDYTNNTVTLGTMAAVGPNGVQFAHASGALLERGLQVDQTFDVPKNRPLIQLDFCPVVRVVGGSGRYGYGRRADDASLSIDDFNLLASLQKFGGPPAWEIWPANTAAGVEPNTGNLWVPAGIMLAYYSEVVVHYVAGFAQANIPNVVKMATAQILTSMLNNPVWGNVKSLQAGQSKVEFLTASAISPDVARLLAPYRANSFA